MKRSVPVARLTRHNSPFEDLCYQAKKRMLSAITLGYLGIGHPESRLTALYLVPRQQTCGRPTHSVLCSMHTGIKDEVFYRLLECAHALYSLSHNQRLSTLREH